MINIKNGRELKAMGEACKIAANALKIAGNAVQPGITTKEIDNIVKKYIVAEGAKPSFLGYGGFPASACISVNEIVIHGIPGDLILKAGDIVSIDIGAYYNGFHGDNAFTFAVGKIADEAQDLLDATKESLNQGIGKAFVGNRMGDISSAIQEYVEVRGYSVVRQFVGHGVGMDLHEEPSVPNFGTSGHGVRLVPGMTLAIEPMINQGSYYVRVLEDKWTTITVDGKLSAHFEHTVAITEDGPVIMTVPD